MRLKPAGQRAHTRPNAAKAGRPTQTRLPLNHARLHAHIAKAARDNYPRWTTA